MKKILIASTALMLVAGAASADVTIAGSGYFGMGYNKDGSSAFSGKKTGLLYRYQLDLNASKTTDSGLTFHGTMRIRAENDISPTNPNGGSVGVTAGGFDLSVGDVTDAYDASNVVYNSEIGICGCGGEVITRAVESSSAGHGNNAILATYTMGGFIGRLGYQQTNGNGAGSGEVSIGGEYKIGSLDIVGGYLTGKASGSGSEVENPGGTALGAGVKYHGGWLGGDYTLGNSHIGLLAGTNAADGVQTQTILTLYGTTSFGPTTVTAFASTANKEVDSDTTKASYGIGATYDLGSGAALIGHVRRDRTKNTLADLGVTFKF